MVPVFTPYGALLFERVVSAAIFSGSRTDWMAASMCCEESVKLPTHAETVQLSGCRVSSCDPA